MKWSTDEDTFFLAVAVDKPVTGLRATPADIVQCLKANPEAAAEVLAALTVLTVPGERAYTVSIDTKAVAASQAERERDEARAERDVATKEEDRAKLNLAKAAEQIRALRSRLAKTEQVVRGLADKWEADLLTYTDPSPECVSAATCLRLCLRELRNALRALDSPVGAGTDSGGSGAASEGTAIREDAGTAPHGSERSSPPDPPEPAGSSQDSPVGVAATAVGAACRGCGQPLASDFAAQRIADGCPCNSRRGINHGLVPVHVCTCATCDPEQTGSVRQGPDPQAPATRAEVEELRRRVERLENLMGCTPKE